MAYKYATTLEQSVTMYSLSADEDNVKYWKDWAKKFIRVCKEVMGWEVEPGPGTSLGIVASGMQNIYYSSYNWIIPSPGSSGWDCDWTQSDGISLIFQGNDYTALDYKDGSSIYSNTYNRLPSWFRDYPKWDPYAYVDTNGIDEETGRFDFIVYTGVSDNGEKIGFRVKFPICTVGYDIKDDYYGMSNNIGNYLWGVPSFSIYSNQRKNIEDNYPTVSKTFSPSSIQASTEETSYSAFSSSGYVYMFGNIPPNVWDSNNNYAYWQQYYFGSENPETPKWSLEYQDSDNYINGQVIGRISDGLFTKSLETRKFKNTWFHYNLFNYHFSNTGDTSYMYISNAEGKIGVRILTTKLDNGEVIVMIERQQIADDDTLCEVAGLTGEENNKLVHLPTRPYTKTSSGINRFSFSRMLLPGQYTLCKELYYVVKRDIDDTLGKGQYVIVKDKTGIDHYFRVIPFGAKTVAEVSGDNSTYLAFPILGPNEVIEEDEDENT